VTKSKSRVRWGHPSELVGVDYWATSVLTTGYPIGHGITADKVRKETYVAENIVHTLGDRGPIDVGYNTLFHAGGQKRKCTEQREELWRARGGEGEGSAEWSPTHMCLTSKRVKFVCSSHTTCTRSPGDSGHIVAT